ncbi:MAG TPA: NAD(P)/FAD-dependent oxidoreductase [Solirubrobacterales bacterium]|nr:NAD(P)/FAD-dependent oxidoreductase [Solirubrobacterales bacterium]
MAIAPVPDFDVAVVGASVAGCTAARLFAQQGARVALIEKRPDPEAFKVACTHAILPAGTPTIERLGLVPLLEERGVPRTWTQFWTPFGGWFGLPDARGWGTTRRTLDPLLRSLAAETPGVELMAGWSAAATIASPGRTGGVEVRDRDGAVRLIRARLLVGADGRGSQVARLAGVRGRVRPHNRFFYFAPWRGVPPVPSAADPSIRLWMLDPAGGAHFPNEGGITVLVAVFPRTRMAEVRADVEGSYERFVRGLPDGPDLAGAERAGKIVGKLEVPNVLRAPSRPGLAFVGDAALATDPLFGAGISFALESAERLVDETAEALGDERALDAALRRYARGFALRFWPHHLQMSAFSLARPATPLERVTLRRATTDAKVARALGEVLSRERAPTRLLDPRLALRLALPRRAGASA